MTQTSQQIAAMLRDYGVSHFFFEPVILPETVKAMVDHGIQPVMTHGEKAAAYMADGYARVSGRVGVCGAQSIGSTNLAAGLRDGYMARSPIVALTGGPDVNTRYRNLYQDLDDHGAFESVTKWNALVDDHTRFPDLLRQAFRAATSGTPRPVHLELAGNTGNMGDQPAAGEGYAEPRFGSAPSSRGRASEADIAEAVALLEQAERPVVIAGNGVMSGRATQALLAFARARTLPVLTSLNGMAAIAFGDPLRVGTVGKYGTDAANQVLHRADVIVAVGTSLGSLTTNEATLIAPSARIVQVDVDGEEVGRVYRCEVPLVGDARAVLEQLAATPPVQVSPEWWTEIGDLLTEWAEQVRADEESASGPTRPERLMTLVSEHAADTAVFVADTGHIAHWVARHLRLREGQGLIRAAGSLGWGLSAAIGAQCAAPDREVVCLTGDGGFYYHLAELETARRYDLPLIVVVNNNTALNQEAFLWDATDPRQDRNWRFVDVDIVAVARGLGCHAARVDDPEDFAAAWDAAKRSGLPAVLDVRTPADAIAARSWKPGP